MLTFASTSSSIQVIYRANSRERCASVTIFKDQEQIFHTCFSKVFQQLLKIAKRLMSYTGLNTLLNLLF